MGREQLGSLSTATPIPPPHPTKRYRSEQGSPVAAAPPPPTLDIQSRAPHPSTLMRTPSPPPHVDSETSPRPICEQSTTPTDSSPTTESGISKKRLNVYLRGKFLEPFETCSRLIRNYKGYNWKSVSKETKDFYYEEFMKNYIWDKAITSQVKKVWKTKAAGRYGDMVCDAKKQKPDFVNQETWKRWRRYWSSPEFKGKSEIYTKNRMSKAPNGKAMGTHTGGTITHHLHEKRLARKLGRKPTTPELHVHTHTKNHDGKTFTNQKSKKIHDDFTSMKEALAQTDETVDENDL